MNTINEWFIIPGFRCYEININTKEVRSHKHYKNDPFHIMQVRDGKVTIVDDYGKSRSMNVESLYDMTFNSGYELNSRRNGEYWVNGMVKGLRACKSNVNVLTGEIYFEEKEEPAPIILDFTSVVEKEQKKIRPFIIKPY